MSKTIKFLQINLHHAKGASGVLCQTFTKENVGVALIQEPWAHKGQVLGLDTKKDKIIYNDMYENPRTAILINRDLKFVPVTEFILKDIVAIKLQIPTARGETEAYIASAYFPGDVSEVPPPEVASFIKFCKQNNKQFIIGCDANSHHTIWGSTDINNRGEDLYEYISTNNIDLCNKGDHPTFITKTRQEVLDLTMSSPFITIHIKKWHVSDEESLSDHRHIEFEYDPGELMTLSYRIPRKTNWEKYKRNLLFNNLTLSQNIETKNTLGKAAQNVTEAIMLAFNASCPIKKGKSNRDVRWWNETLRHLRKNTRRLFKQAKNQNSGISIEVP